jgi:hypothetical protein
MPLAAAGLSRSTVATRQPCTRSSAAGSITRPCQVRSTTRVLSNSAATCIARSTGMAKPIPAAPARTATLMPIISPSMFTSGPPELPGLMAASV